MTLGTQIFGLLFACSLTTGCSVLRSYDEIHRHFNAADNTDRPSHHVNPFPASSARQGLSLAGKFYRPAIA